MQQSYRFFLLSLLTLLLATPVMGLSEVPMLDGDAREILADLPALKGTQAIDIAALQNKPLLVTFFASWCPPCREEFSHLNRLQELYQDTDLTIVAINVFEAWDDNDESRMDSFLEFTQPNFPTLAGPSTSEFCLEVLIEFRLFTVLTNKAILSIVSYTDVARKRLMPRLMSYATLQIDFCNPSNI